MEIEAARRISVRRETTYPFSPYEYSNPSHSSTVKSSQNLEYPIATV